MLVISGWSPTLAFGLSGFCLIGASHKLVRSGHKLGQQLPATWRCSTRNISKYHEIHQLPLLSASIRTKTHEGPWTCMASSGRKNPAWTIALRDVTGSMVVCTSPTGWMVAVTCRRDPCQVDHCHQFFFGNVCGWHMFSCTISLKAFKIWVWKKTAWLVKQDWMQCVQDGKASKKGGRIFLEFGLHWPSSDFKTPKVMHSKTNISQQSMAQHSTTLKQIVFQEFSYFCCPPPKKKYNTYTPWKINMEHTNHPFRKENDLPNLHDYVPC